MVKILRPTVIDLFAGVGGLSLGFEQAGFDITAAVEIDPIHAAAHQFNFPECTVLTKSVADVTATELFNISSGRPIDVIVGGAPCQGFSLMGQRALDDPRNALIKEYIRIVAEVKPQFFLFENVKGLTVGNHKTFLEEIVNELTDAGYTVTSPWQVLNAKHYGVPQSRERLFLIGQLNSDPALDYPPVQEMVVSCQDALGDLPDAEFFEALIHSDKASYRPLPAQSEYAREMRCESSGAWHFSYQRYWDKTLLTSSLRTKHTFTTRNRFVATPPGQIEPISRFFKLSKAGVANTLRAGTDSARGAFTSPRPIHYEYARCVTVREMARLHGFPDWFRFHRTKWHGARQIGNAVPPPLARAMGTQIIQAMGLTPSRPRQILPLGDESLLRMDMSQTSQYWGVANPIAKRDRRRGARKRTRVEVSASSQIDDSCHDQAKPRPIAIAR